MTGGPDEFCYHVPQQYQQSDGEVRILLTVEGITEEVADYMGRAHLCDMATLGHHLTTAPGRSGRFARWVVRRSMQRKTSAVPTEPQLGDCGQPNAETTQKTAQEAVRG